MLLHVLKRGWHVSLNDVGGVFGLHDKHFDHGVGSPWLLADKDNSDGEDDAQRARPHQWRWVGVNAGGWVAHLWIGNGNGARVLFVAEPSVLYVVHISVVGLNVSQVLPLGRPPETLTGGEHLLCKRKRAVTLGRI